MAVLCCIAGDFVWTVSLEAAESLPNVFWKKSEMLAEMLRSSHDLFLDVCPPPAAPGVLSLLESWKYWDCVGLGKMADGYLEWSDLLGEEAEWLLESLGKK